MFNLSFEPPIEYLDSVRALLGVTTEELPDNVLLTLSIVGQAEQDLYLLIPTVKTELEAYDTEEFRINQLMLVFINLIAFYAFMPLKVSLLASETDNKTMATRFKDALSRDPNEFKNNAKKLAAQVSSNVAYGTPDLFSVVPPAKDVITGR